eukprot:scaffold67896_cov60-Phaeocystis_antarctica.AAC.6
MGTRYRGGRGGCGHRHHFEGFRVGAPLDRIDAVGHQEAHADLNGQPSHPEIRQSKRGSSRLVHRQGTVPRACPAARKAAASRKSHTQDTNHGRDPQCGDERCSRRVRLVRFGRPISRLVRFEVDGGCCSAAR